MTGDLDPRVANAFESFPPKIRVKLLRLRKFILDTAGNTDGVGPITETLKWGEPAYLTPVSKSGSTIRLGWKTSAPDRYALYFNCQTDLIESFRARFSDQLTFEGNRAITLDASEEPPLGPLSACIAAALTYHRDKKTARRK